MTKEETTWKLILTIFKYKNEYHEEADEKMGGSFI